MLFSFEASDAGLVVGSGWDSSCAYLGSAGVFSFVSLPPFAVWLSVLLLFGPEQFGVDLQCGALS